MKNNTTSALNSLDLLKSLRAKSQGTSALRPNQSKGISDSTYVGSTDR